MKEMRKALALALAVIMATAAFAGCGQTETKVSEESSSVQASVAESTSQEPEVAEPEPKDPITLEWYYAGNGMQQDTQKVEDYVNELLKDFEGLEHVTLHLNCFTNDVYKDQVALAQTAGKQMDIIQTYKLDYNQEVANGTFIALDDYLAMDEYADLYNELPEWLWNQVVRDGSTYVVPIYQIGATSCYVFLPEEYAQYGDLDVFRSFDIHDVSTVTAYCEEIEKITLAVREAEGTTTKYCAGIAGSISTYGDFVHRDIFDQKSGFMLLHGDETVTNIYLTDAWKEACRFAAKWVEEGLLPADLGVRNTSTWSTKYMLDPESYILTIGNGYGSEELQSEKKTLEYGFDTVAVNMYEDYFFRASWGAGGNGITTTCENPEDALTLLQALNTAAGAEIYNALVYGLEGVHYEKVDDTHIKTLEYDSSQGGTSTTYAGWKWILGNTSYVYLNQGCTEGEAELVKEINENPDNLASILLGGFNLVLDPVSTEIAQCRTVVEEYSSTLTQGAKGADWEAYYDEFVAKLEAAGVQKVMDYIQGELDAFLSTK